MFQDKINLKLSDVFFFCLEKNNLKLLTKNKINFFDGGFKKKIVYQYPV